MSKKLNGVEFVSNAIKISQKMNGVLEGSLAKVLANSQRSVIESFTKNFSNKPIDSGQLRASIRSKKTNGTEGEVFTNKHYAAHVEYGTVKMKGRPYFRKGIADAEQKNLNIIRYDLQTKLK